MSFVVIAVILAGILLLVIINAISRGQDRKKAKPTTVLVCGATGVGKSTLINTIAKRPVVEVGIGKPVTQNTVYVEVPEAQMAFYDSKGLEVEEASQTYLLLLSDLLRLRYQRDHFRQVDIVLICILEPQARFDDAHEEIAALCSDLQIPYGIALTQADDNAAFRRKVEEAFTSAKFIVPVRSLPLKIGSTTIPAEGIDDLTGLLDKHQGWNSDEGRRRRERAAATETLAASARSLANSPTDSAWQSFASTGFAVMLKPQKGDPTYPLLVKQLRDRIRKTLVPNFLDRVLMKKFDNEKIDTAIAKRLIPPLIRTFTRREGMIDSSSLGQVTSEAIALLETDRPYRGRFD